MAEANVNNTELKNETPENDVKGTETVKETKTPRAFITETYEKVVDAVKTSTEKYRDMIKEKKSAYKEKYVQPVVDKGTDIRDKVKAEYNKVYDKALETGKKLIPESTIKTVEEKWDKGLRSIFEKVNLPTRNDMDRLTKAMEALNSKMDMPNEKYSV